MKKQRELAEEAERQTYFETAQIHVSEPEEGTREMGELYPFLMFTPREGAAADSHKTVGQRHIVEVLAIGELVNGEL